MTPEQLAAIRARADAATKGPWYAHGEFIVHARSDVPALLVALDEARADRDDWTRNWNRVDHERAEAVAERDALRAWTLRVSEASADAATAADKAEAERNALRAENERMKASLWRCAELSGADLSGYDGPPVYSLAGNDLGELAVRCVDGLRADYDSDPDRADLAEARRLLGETVVGVASEREIRAFLARTEEEA